MGIQINGTNDTITTNDGTISIDGGTTITGSLTGTTGVFSGDVGVAGTLTSEDKTNIDSVGLITARTGIKIGPITGVAATHYADGSIRTTGVVTATQFYGGGGNLTGISADVVDDTSPQLGGNLDVNTKNIIFGDSSNGSSDDVLIFGAGSDLKLYHSGTHSFINNSTGNLNFQTSGNIWMENQGGTKVWIKALADAAVELYHNNSKKFETYASGTLTTGNLKNTGSVYVGNQVDGHDGNSTGQLFFGASNDLKMYHDGTDATIKNITGDLKIEALGGTSDDILMSANDDFVLKVAATETAITASANGGVALYYNDARTCYTINNGLTFDDNKILKFGSGGDVQVFYDGTNYYTYAANEGHIKTQFHSANGSWEVETTAGEHRIQCPSSGTATSVRLFWNGSPKLDTQSSGVYVTGSVSESSDIALKENIQPLSNSLANLKQLNGYSYKFKDTEKETGAKALGLTAQEVEKVYPDLVQGEEGSKSLQYSGLIAPLLEAIKELSTEVEALKTKVAALESS